MKLDRVIWGVLLLFIGGVLLLDNFDIIEFYWRNVWRFFPVFIIILGINILFNKNNSQTGHIISLGVLVVTLGFLFVQGQQKPERLFSWSFNNEHHREYNNDDNDDEDSTVASAGFTQPFTAGDENKTAVLNISGGGTSFELKENTDNLFDANVDRSKNKFLLSTTSEDSTNVVNFKMKDNKKGHWSVGEGNNVSMKLNDKPTWDIHVKVGAGEVDFDLSQHKVRRFTFDGGVAELEVKIGDQLPITDVDVKSGLTSTTVLIPEGSGCRITAKTGLSSRDFEGFTKVGDNTYETPNYNSATKKIFIRFDGGLTSFEVKKY